MSIGGDGPAISMSATGSEGQYGEEYVVRHRSSPWSHERAKKEEIVIDGI